MDPIARTTEDFVRSTAFARALASGLRAEVSTFSLTAEQAVAKAKSAIALRKRLTDDEVEISVAIVAPNGKKFPARLMWDAVYSAGFRWGDGDYFHWNPSPTTDDSQGIGMGTSTRTGYFFPEWVADGTGDVDDLEMSFSAARAYQPTKLFDVMVRAATYLARRLGGTVVRLDDRPFDAAAERKRVVAIEQAMLAAGVEPGSTLALRTF